MNDITYYLDQNQTIGQVILDCHGRACPKCKRCCDWKNGVKRGDATCYRVGLGPGHTGYCDCVGHCCCGYNGYNYHPYTDVCCSAENKLDTLETFTRLLNLIKH
ncbi:unnamed protein product [Adineta steineri]|uniref:Uncharacterized protein n=1 Tax=Adineta steineri TaxID=433720 RepID=A0A814SAG9_9BILA|nr:unnamed protein product [Adineta steineri]CAF1144784.1 unnamed protein product [Adineta steineri]CAF1385929.1 unnamed protein product [Adineta steineri]CAF3869432.1 unnamed protein product [Adineta steineri]